MEDRRSESLALLEHGDVPFGDRERAVGAIGAEPAGAQAPVAARVELPDSLRREPSASKGGGGEAEERRRKLCATAGLGGSARRKQEPLAGGADDECELKRLDVGA